MPGAVKNLAKLDGIPGQTIDFGTLLVGKTSADTTITIQNRRTGNASVLSGGIPTPGSPFAFKGGSYPGTGGTCGTTLAAGATCTQVLVYAPTGGGAVKDTLQVSYFDGESTVTSALTLTGTGISRGNLSLNFSPSFNFSSTIVSASQDQVLVLNNGGQTQATGIVAGTLVNGFSFKGGSYPGTGGTCTATLDPGSTCTLVVTFAPAAASSASSTLSLSYFDGLMNQTLNLSLTGTGITAALLSLSNGPTFNFGSVYVGSNASNAFVVTNSGQANATLIGAGAPALGAPYSFLGSSYPGTGGTCGASLLPGANCTIVTQFAPAALGTFNDTVRIQYFDGNATQTATLPLTGTGVLANLVFPSAPTFNFPQRVYNSTGNSAITITNTGGGTATAMGAGVPLFAAPFAYAGGSYPGTGGSCGSTLAAGASCTLMLSFSPTAVTTYNDTVRVSYSNGQSNQSSSVAISGAGITASLSISDGPTYSFGSQILSTSTDHTFTVTNSGAATANGIAQGNPALSAPFSFKGGAFPGTGGTCTSALAGSGATCTIVITYRPSGTGTSNQTVTLSYSDSVNTLTATRALTGTGITAYLTLSDQPTYDYGSRNTYTHTTHAFTVTNSGGATASGIAQGLPALSAPFSFAGGSYPGTGGTCGATLAASASCTTVVDFFPTAAGSTSETFSLAYSDSVNNYSVSVGVTGTGVIPPYQNVDVGVFNGSNSSLSCGTTGLDFSSSNPFTLAAWIKTSNSGSYNMIIDEWGPGGARPGLELFLDPSGYPSLALFSTTNFNEYQAQTGYADGAWHFIAVAYSGNGASVLASDVSFYVDNVLKTTIVLSSSAAGQVTTGSAVTIGTRNGGGLYFNGNIDEVSFYNRAISSSDVTTLWGSGQTGNASGISGLLSWFRFEPLVLTPADTSSTIYDRMGSNNCTNNSVTFSTSVP